MEGREGGRVKFEEVWDVLTYDVWKYGKRGGNYIESEVRSLTKYSSMRKWDLYVWILKSRNTFAILERWCVDLSTSGERKKIKWCAGKYDEFDSVRFTLVCRLAQESTEKTLNFFCEKIVTGSGERAGHWRHFSTGSNTVVPKMTSGSRAAIRYR